MPTVKPVLVVVDDEPYILESLSQLLEADCEVHVFTRGRDALAFLAENDVAMIISDQRMPDMAGTKVLERAKDISPLTVRILLTGYSDMDAVVSSVNTSAVFRYLRKPWNNDVLRGIVQTALITHQLAKKRAQTNAAEAAAVQEETPLVRQVPEGIGGDRAVSQALQETIKAALGAADVPDFLQVYVPFFRAGDENLENVLVVSLNLEQLERLGESIGGKYRTVVTSAIEKVSMLLQKGIVFDAMLIDEAVLLEHGISFWAGIQQAAPTLPKVIVLSPKNFPIVAALVRQTNARQALKAAQAALFSDAAPVQMPLSAPPVAPVAGTEKPAGSTSLLADVWGVTTVEKTAPLSAVLAMLRAAMTVTRNAG